MEDIASLSLNPTFLRVFSALLIVALIFTVSWLLTFILQRLADRFQARRLFFKGLQPIPQIGGYAVAAYVVITFLSPGRESLLAILGSVALALALAAQDLIKDLIGGIVVLVDTSFQIGDRIRVNDFYGEVSKIGLRSTKLITPDDSLVTIPNSILLQGGVSNTNAGAVDCLVTTHIYLPPHVDLVAIENIAREAVMTSKSIRLDKPMTVLIKEELIESRLTHMEIRAYVFDTRYEEVFATELTRRIKKAFYENDIIPEDLGSDEDIFKEMKLDKLDERIRRAVGDSVVDLGFLFAERNRAKSRTNGA